MDTNQILEVVENLLKRQIAPLEQLILIQSVLKQYYQEQNNSDNTVNCSQLNHNIYTFKETIWRELKT